MNNQHAIFIGVTPAGNEWFARADSNGTVSENAEAMRYRFATLWARYMVDTAKTTKLSAGVIDIAEDLLAVDEENGEDVSRIVITSTTVTAPRFWMADLALCVRDRADDIENVNMHLPDEADALSESATLRRHAKRLERFARRFEARTRKIEIN